MNIPYRYLYCSGLSICLISLMLLYSYGREFNTQAAPVPTQSEKCNSNVDRADFNTSNAQTRLRKNFLYLIQTEKCLPDRLLSSDILGNEGECQCDILVLSFKEECIDKSLPHAIYSLQQGTTWSTGRAKLYAIAMESKMKYLYYIFMDDDVILKRRNRNDRNPWRMFELFLLFTEPPLAAVDNKDWNFVDRIYSLRQQRGCNLNDNINYFLAIWFDGMFNAFHYKAIQYILQPVLPYWSKFDGTSWWFAQWYVNIMTDVAFHNQAVMHSRIYALNPVHRSYPKRMHNPAVISALAKDIVRALPGEVQNKQTLDIIQRWESRYTEVLMSVEDTYCRPPPPVCPQLVPFTFTST